ncbi:MAG: hypothetical protein ACLRWH_03915 [Emergencia sp.]
MWIVIQSSPADAVSMVRPVQQTEIVFARYEFKNSVVGGRFPEYICRSTKYSKRCRWYTGGYQARCGVELTTVLTMTHLRNGP